MAYVYFDGRAVRIIDDSTYTQKSKTDNFTDQDSTSHFIPTKTGGAIEFPKPTSEIADAIDRLNADELDSKTGMTKIDMNSRLHSMEISSILIIDFLVANRVLPRRMLSLTRQKKRLSVSEGGKGREEIVNIAAGMKENKAGEGLFGRIKNVFSPPKN